MPSYVRPPVIMPRLPEVAGGRHWSVCADEVSRAVTVRLAREMFHTFHSGTSLQTIKRCNNDVDRPARVRTIRNVCRVNVQRFVDSFFRVSGRIEYCRTRFGSNRIVGFPLPVLLSRPRTIQIRHTAYPSARFDGPRTRSAQSTVKLSECNAVA